MSTSDKSVSATMLKLYTGVDMENVGKDGSMNRLPHNRDGHELNKTLDYF